MLGTIMIASQTIFDSIMPFDNILFYLMHLGTMSIYILILGFSTHVSLQAHHLNLL